MDSSAVQPPAQAQAKIHIAVNGDGDTDSLDSASVIGHARYSKATDYDAADPLSSFEDQPNLLARLLSFVTARPKLCVFIGINIAISGIPLATFTAFALSIALWSFAIGIIISLIGASLFTATSVGFALLILVPMICFTTFVACSIAFWIVAGIYIYEWVSYSRTEDAHSPVNSASPVDQAKGVTVEQWSTEFRKLVETQSEKD